MAYQIMMNRDTSADATSLDGVSVGPRNKDVSVNRPTRSGEGLSSGVFEILLRYWRLIGVLVIVATGIGIAMALLMTPVYRSSALLMPAESNARYGMLGGILGDVGGMGALAGLGLGTSKNTVTTEALALLKSRQFIEDFIQAHGLMPVLFRKEWDASRRGWKPSIKRPPTLWKGYKLFTNSVLDVYQDQKTDLVTVSVDWTNRDTAAQWANDLVSAVNDQVRSRAIREADQTIGYLQTEIQSADTIELRQALNAMLENQVKVRAIAAVRKQYAFRVLDAAAPADPDVMLRPRKGLYIVIAPFIGLALGVALATLVDARRHRRPYEARDPK